jgi:REP element-mobilizing transposase RayT
MTKMDAATKKKVASKRLELRNTRGELAEYQEALEDENLSDEQIDILERRIDFAKNKIEMLQLDLREMGDIAEEINQITKKLTQKEENELIETLIKKNHIGYLIEDNKFIYCLQMAVENNNGVVNPQFRTVETSKIVNVLNKMANFKLQCDTYSVQALFQSTKNDYYGMTGSFNDEKWDNTMVYNKMSVIREFWVKETTDTNYNPDFDFLMYCVGGGKQENIEHLEKWLAYKWKYPNRNANIPNIDLGGYPGGNGKGRFIELLKTIFTHGCVVPAALKELTDGFNASWETAVILYYDEPATGELPEGKLKNATGGEEQRIEKKGIDAYTADRNYNMIFTSNNPNGVVKLAGTGGSGEDRRWSVITTDKVMVDEIMVAGLDNEGAKVRTNEINNLLKNREEVSKWLSHLLIKHDVENMQILHSLHGVDYEKRFEDQKDTVQLVFDSLMNTFNQCGIITLDVLTQAVHELTNNTKLSSQQIAKRFTRYLDQGKIKYEYLKKERINLLYEGSVSETVQKNCFKLPLSNTNYGLDYKMFTNIVPNKSTKLLASDFTISI